jgi:hypothetical protein
VVLGDVEDGRGLAAQRLRVVQLEAGQLDREHVVRRRVHHCLDDRPPDVADGRGAEAGRAQDVVEHLHRRGLAVGAGDRQPRRRPLRVAEPPRQLDLAPHRDAAGRRLLQQRVVGSPTRTHHEQVDGVGQRGGRALPQSHGRAEHLQQLGLLGLGLAGALVEGGDRGAEMGQVVGRGEPADAEACDGRADLRPVAGPVEGRDVSHQ